MKDDVENMKKRMRSVLIAFMLLATLLLVTACSNSNNPYDKNDGEGYTVSVRYDANGGTFTTNTSLIIDSYNISAMTPNGNGNVELALLSPDNEIRGKGNYFAPVRNGYFMAGWYTERTETGKDEKGDPIYSYANKWDFSKDLLEVDSTKTYTSSEPVVTLYAAWVPLFEINFYSVADGEKIGTYTYNPLEVEEIKVPEWGEDGAMEMYKFPVKNGYTFEAAYYDNAQTQLVENEVVHAGYVDDATGTAINPSMNLYVSLKDGNWFHIYNVEQFRKHASINGSYILHADLDFDGAVWPSSLMYGSYNGTIQGNGHTISNVKLEQTNNSKEYAGLFGALGSKAMISDLILDNVTFTVQAGTRGTGTTFGLLAGTISADAVLGNVKIINSTLIVMDTAYFANDTYAIGKICGAGYRDTLDFSGITCKAVDDNGNVSSKISLLEDGNEVYIVKN